MTSNTPLSALLDRQSRSKMKPKLKPMVEHLWHDGRLQFFKRPGLAITLKDETGFIHDSCELMTGLHSVDDLIEQLSHKHPKSAIWLPKLLNALDGEQLLEDTSVSHSDHDDRWQTNTEFFNAFSDTSTNKHSFHDTLSQKRIVILGLGGVGSNVAIQLLAMGCQHITAIDFDHVSVDNLNRQLAYNPSCVGQLKTEAFKYYAASFAPEASVNCITSKIESAEQLVSFLDNADLLICAIDEPRSTVLDWVNLACLRTNTPWVCGGVDYQCLSYFSIIPNQSGCISCWRNQARNTQPLFQDLIQHENFVAGQKINVATMPYISMLTGLVSNEAIKLLTRYSEPLAVGKLWLFNCISNDMRIHEQWKRSPNCPVYCL